MRKESNLQRQHTSRNVKHPRGVSLIEMMVVVSMLSLVLSLTGATLHLLLRSEKIVSQSLVMERTIAKLAYLFRDDAHRSRTAVQVADEDSLELRLNDETDSRIRYRIAKGHVTRLVLDQGKIAFQDDFNLPECEVQIGQDESSGSQFVSLIIERPRLGIQKHSQAPQPLRKLEITSSLNLNRRLIASLSSTIEAEKIAGSVNGDER